MTNDAVRNAWGTTIFSDDIRSEIQGTATIVGIYNGLMTVNVPFPVMLPKLALLVKYFETPESYSEDGILRVYFPGIESPIIEAQLPFADMRKQQTFETRPHDEDLDAIHTFEMPLILSPVSILHEGFIKVRLSIGGTVLRMGALRINSATIISNATASVQPS